VPVEGFGGILNPFIRTQPEYLGDRKKKKRQLKGNVGVWGGGGGGENTPAKGCVLEPLLIQDRCGGTSEYQGIKKQAEREKNPLGSQELLARSIKWVEAFKVLEKNRGKEERKNA